MSENHICKTFLFITFLINNQRYKTFCALLRIMTLSTYVHVKVIGEGQGKVKYLFKYL